MKRSIHVVAFQRPYPPTYGGVIDVYYRIKALHDLGLHVILHTFAYNDRTGHSPELGEIADEIYYYTRDISLKSHFSRLPYIVMSRRSPKLLDNLLKDDAPILFEGVHCSFYLGHPSLRNRYKILRAHNIEHRYYKSLALSPGRLTDRLYYLIESLKLKAFEPKIRNADLIASLSQSESEYFKRKYGGTETRFIPVFSNDTYPPVTASGDYVLYHGNLSVAENVKAVKWILTHVATQMPGCRFVFAGHRPSKILADKINALPNASLIADPTELHMDSLVDRARVHLLITFQATGVKLKLLNVLSRQATVIANSLMVEGSGMEPYCIIADTPDTIRDAISRQMQSHLSETPANQFKLPSSKENAIRLLAGIRYYDEFLEAATKTSEPHHIEP